MSSASRSDMLVSGARGSTRVSLYSFAFFPLDRQRREPAPPRLLRRRKSLRPPVAPCQAPTVVALEAVPTVDEDGAAWWPNAPVLADSSSNAEQAEPRRAEPELQDHGAATHGDARSLSAQNHRVSYALHNLSLHPPNAALALPNRPFRHRGRPHCLRHSPAVAAPRGLICLACGVRG